MSTRHILALALLLVALWKSQAQGQALVLDAANLTQNTTTALQQTLTTIEAVLQTGYMVLELTGMDDEAFDEEFWNDLNTLQSLVGDAQSMAWDLHSITRHVTTLFSLKGAPESSLGLYERQQDMRRTLLEAQTTAIRVQTLIRTAQHTVKHIQRFVARINAFVGNKQALQNINESTAALARLQSAQNATTAAFERAATLQAMEAPLIQESLIKINQHFCGRWCQ